MNLKEAFRYQNFLDGLMQSASVSVGRRDHCLKTVKKHHCNASNPDASDFEEEVIVDDYIPNDIVINFMLFLIDEKDVLTTAISNAKAKIGFNIDAAVEQNKFRQNAYKAIRGMLRYTPSKRIESGYGHKFNVEGNQVQYCYDVEVEMEDTYDRVAAKSTMRRVIAAADEISSKIDEAKVNTVVDYNPPFDVNESFEDVMESFIKMNMEKI